jgi:hypothetical protein
MDWLEQRLVTEDTYSILFKSNIKLTRWLEKAHP